MSTPQEAEGLRIGEIAAATGLTVRTLHHYEQVGLVQPSGRTHGGHRWYSQEALTRLYQVSMLRSLGLSLAQINTYVRSRPGDLSEVLAEHLALVDERLDHAQRIRTRLATLLERLADDTDATSDLLSILEDIVTLQPVLQRRISILVYTDLEAAYHYLIRVFAMGAGELTWDDGHVVHAIVHAGDGELWLHPESEHWALASPQHVGAGTATTAVMVEDVDDHYRHAAAEGAEIAYTPIDQPYGFREYGAVDLEGHLWSFMKPLE